MSSQANIQTKHAKSSRIPWQIAIPSVIVGFRRRAKGTALGVRRAELASRLNWVGPFVTFLGNLESHGGVSLLST
jgi:hypothetical protein